MKKRKLKKKAVFISIVSFLLLIFIFIIIVFKDDLIKKIETPSTLKKEDKTSISLLIAGNVLLNSNIIQDGLITDKEYDFDYLLSDINTIKDNFDLKYYNQSSIFGGPTLGYSSGNKYNTPNALLDTMTKLKFNLVSIASQYSYDKGEKGIKNTIDFIKTKKLLYSGINTSKEEKNQINTKETNKIKYNLLSYTMNTNTVIPSEKDYLINIYDKNIVKKDIEKSKSQADLTIVTINWKETGSSEITEEQKEVAKYLSDLGVDIVIGNNSFIQPITKIKNTIVLYSSGNLIIGDINEDKRTSILTNFDITITKKNNKVVSKEYLNIKSSLLYVNNTNNSNFKVVPYSSLNGTMLKNYKELYNKYSDIISKEIKDISIEKVGD